MRADGRPDSEATLEEVREDSRKAGKLKIYFGYAAGIGKTHAMLDDAQEQYRSGVDVLVGCMEPHTHPETAALLRRLPRLALKAVPCGNAMLQEFDLDEALRQKPALILIDGLAHTNAGGVRNKKRYQDVEELLAAGIDVYTTVNVQHLESMNDIVEDITKIKVEETVPDHIFDEADKVRLIDIDPDELLRRFAAGKICRPEHDEAVMRNFFTRENLKLLREIALRKVANRISYENQHEQRTAEKMASTKILACFGPSPSSEKCLRWAARAAEAFHAQWEAVYVESIDSASLTGEQQRNIRANMGLAEQLGAQVVTLTGHDIAIAVSEYARMSGIANIVIGKSRKGRSLREMFEPALEDKLIALLPSVEVHIIPSQAGKPGYRPARKARRGVRFHFSWKDAAIVLVLTALATLFSYALRTLHIGDQNVIMVYLLSVLIVSRVTRGYVYGVAASVISVMVFNFFFTEPYFTFTAARPGYPVTFLIMLLVALITSALTVRIKTQARLAVVREHRTDMLYEINKKLLATRGTHNIVRLISDYIVMLSDRAIMFYTADPEEGAEGFLTGTPEDDGAFLKNENERAVAHWVFVNQKRAGAGTDTLMGAGALYMPVIAQGKVLAVWGVSCRREALDHGGRLFLSMIASQVALALERQRLSDEQRATQVESESEKMRATLLRAISHDIRTPLAGILGASSALREGDAELSFETRDKLLSDIQKESQWLIRMVENLLSITRINQNASKVAKTAEAAEEVVAEAVNRVKRRFPKREIRVRVPDQLLEVPMDGTLIVQVLINLLENAIKYSKDGTPVEVSLRREGDRAVFEVLDRGRGISEDALPWRAKSGAACAKSRPDASRGMGIGLTICDTIVRAHGGALEAENRAEGGAEFRFSLPLGEGA
ncbi:MAG: sensor histidine kinase KdpD [Clostridiaceae bacterium]|nr:sensor histidine kinase KdpD [Eubacteriales bacterium]